MLVLRNVLAHHVLVWGWKWLAEKTPRLKRYGMLRFVSDLMSVGGIVELDRRDCGVIVRELQSHSDNDPNT